MENRKFEYGNDSLTLKKVMMMAEGKLDGFLSQRVRQSVETSRKNVETMAISDKAIYGINTGFGPLCDVQISPSETNLLQRNLLLR